MTSERAWRLRLLAAVGAAAGSVAVQSACIVGDSSCPDDAIRQDKCFTKAELAADVNPDAAAGSDGGTAACPSAQRIQETRLNGFHVESVSDNGDTCCYRGYYPCEGRPLLRGDEPVLAPTVPRGDWCFDDASNPTELHLDPATRAALASAWARDAAFEHASIASFANFIVELLAFGAPAELVADAQRALGDEVRHAELCYALASRYAGRRVGPGPLEVPAFAPRSLRDAAVAAFREGCIVETQAAYAARLRLELATDPTVRRTLEQIVPDEERHAELAYRFVRWALDRDPTILADLERVFDGVCASFAEPDSRDGNDAETWRAHGQLPPWERRRNAHAAIERIIKPCWRVLAAA